MTIVWTTSVGAEYGRIEIDEATDSVRDTLTAAFSPGGDFDTFGEIGDTLTVIEGD